MICSMCYEDHEDFAVAFHACYCRVCGEAFTVPDQGWDALGMPNWQPSADELRAIMAVQWKALRSLST